jgi:hypothetical protein
VYQGKENMEKTPVLMRIFFSALCCALLLNPLKAQVPPSLQRILGMDGDPRDGGEVLGAGVLPLGDINGDGWPDVAVASGKKQKLQMYFGGPGILDGVPDAQIEGGNTAVICDLNGDGYPDIVSYKPCRCTVTFPDYDTVFVYLGKSSPGLRLDTVPLLRIPSETGGKGFGHYMATGDLNDDGFDDLAILNNGTDYVYIYLGKPRLTVQPDGPTIPTYFRS